MKTAISFIIVFNLIVFVHEFGHFYMARRKGIRVHEFSLGMGPKLFGRESGGVLYALRALPIGGYVKMEGEDEASPAADSFSQKKPWARFQVLVAGAMMNLLLALVLFMLINVQRGVYTPEVASVLPNSPAKIAGIEAGDRIVALDDKKIKLWHEISMYLSKHDSKVEVQVQRGEKLLTMTMKPELDPETGYYRIGISPTHSRNPWMILRFTLMEMSFFIGSIFAFIGGLFTGKSSGGDVVGPIGLVQVVGQAANQGFSSLVFLTAYISMNLGVMNLLPIPALDGGRILFVLIEMLRGKPLAPEREGMVHAIGFALLLLLILVVTYKDIVRIF